MGWLIAYLLGALTAIQGTKNSDNTDHGNDKASPKKQGSPPVERVIPQGSYAVNNGTPSKQGKSWWPQTFTEWVQVFGVLVLTVYTGTTIALWCTANAANRQAKTQWEAEYRPWVGNGEVIVKQSPVFLFYPNSSIGARTQVSFTIGMPIKNFGVSPAFHVATMLMGTMTEQIAAPPTMDSMMVSACQWADNNSKSVGGVLFPSGPETKFEQPTNLGAPLAQIDQVHRVWIAICTAYSGTSDGKHLHHTKVWVASWPTEGQPKEIRRTAQPFTVIYYALQIPGWIVAKTDAD